jgi:acylphosphatase
MSDDAKIAVVHLRIEGRVQGVGYRDWLTRQARANGLRGWVRNRLDGSVEALLIGETTSVEAVIAGCGRGSRMAAVTAVRRSPDSDDGSSGFRQMPTE